MRLKKIDKLVFQAFLGPFVLTFVVVVFILLTTQMLRYLDEIFGKAKKFFDLKDLINRIGMFHVIMFFALMLISGAIIGTIETTIIFSICFALIFLVAHFMPKKFICPLGKAAEEIAREIIGNIGKPDKQGKKDALFNGQ